MLRDDFQISSFELQPVAADYFLQTKLSNDSYDAIVSHTLDFVVSKVSLDAQNTLKSSLKKIQFCFYVIGGLVLIIVGLLISLMIYSLSLEYRHDVGVMILHGEKRDALWRCVFTHSSFLLLAGMIVAFVESSLLIYFLNQKYSENLFGVITFDGSSLPILIGLFFFIWLIFMLFKKILCNKQKVISLFR